MRLEHVFVDSFPEPLEEGKLYVSMQYASAAHLCACGCGNEVVTPIRKRGWKLMFDGESITLSPSIGSHNLNCRSHYFIKENEICWAGHLTWSEITAGRIENQQGGFIYGDDDDNQGNYPVTDNTLESVAPPIPTDRPEPIKSKRKWWSRLFFWR